MILSPRDLSMSDSSKRKRTYNFTAIAQLPDVWDEDEDPPFFKYPYNSVQEILFLMTICEPACRGGRSILQVVQEAKDTSGKQRKPRKNVF